MTQPIWQMQGEHEWVFGDCIRGIVRWPLAEVYFDEDQNPGWVWFIHGNMNEQRGACGNLPCAIEAVEKALGIEE